MNNIGKIFSIEVANEVPLSFIQSSNRGVYDLKTIDDKVTVTQRLPEQQT